MEESFVKILEKSSKSIHKLVKLLEEKTSTLEQKPLVCDRIIFSIASIIFAFSISGFIVDFFKSNEYALACYSQLENRAQYTYINSYCHRHLPIVEYFPVALVAHTAILIVPYYLWTIVFSAKFDTFFSLAAKMETIDEEEDAENLPHKNYAVVKYLQTQFSSKKILISYVVRLIVQFALVVAALAINITVFRDINKTITFECSDDYESSKLFGNVTCAYPKKLYTNILQIVDYSLLVVAMMVLRYGLLWCLNHSTQNDIVQFCYESAIDAKYFIHCTSSKTSSSQSQIINDFMFLLAWLSQTNCGLSRAFKSELIKIKIFQRFNASMKLLKDHEGSCSSKILNYLLAQLLMTFAFCLQGTHLGVINGI